MQATFLKYWDDFLRVAELFKFLSEQVKKYPVHDGKVVFATNEEDAFSTMVDADMSNLTPCSQKDADTCLLLHALDAVHKGSRTLLVHTVDTDVVVLAISKFHQISRRIMDGFWRSRQEDSLEGMASIS